MALTKYKDFGVGFGFASFVYLFHLPPSGEERWIGILDIFGFEHFKNNGLDIFLINTANESIQHTFNHFVFEVRVFCHACSAIS